MDTDFTDYTDFHGLFDGVMLSEAKHLALNLMLARSLQSKETMNNHSVAEFLVNKGKALFHSPREFVTFTASAEADKLLNDIENTPHAFVLACIMDRQIKAETAWLIPYLISEKLGDFKFPTLAALSLQDVGNLMMIPTPLHRFPSVMSETFSLQCKQLLRITAV